MVRGKQSTVNIRQSTLKRQKAGVRGGMWRLLGFLLLTINCQLSTAFPQSFNVANLNEVRYANAYAGSNAGAKISACITDLPATGGACDARGLVGAQTISAAVTVGGSSKPETLILGLGVTYTCAVAPCFIVDSNGHLEGAAISVLPALTSPPTYPAYTANTVIKLADGANPGARGVIESANFANMTGTNGASGYIPSNFSIRNVSIDGNRAHNSSGMGIALYSYQDTLENVEVHAAASHGIWHELGASTPAQTSVLVRATHIKAHDNGGDGVHNIGPTDQYWFDAEASTNNGNGIFAGKTATSSGAGSSYYYGVDLYSNGQAGIGDGFQDEAGSIVIGGQLGEGNTGCGLNIPATGGGTYYLETVHGNARGGLCLGSTGAVSNTVIRGHVYSNSTGELVLTNSGGKNRFDLDLVDWASPPNYVIGTFADSDSYDLRYSGGGTGQQVHYASDGGAFPSIEVGPSGLHINNSTNPSLFFDTAHTPVAQINVNGASGEVRIGSNWPNYFTTLYSNANEAMKLWLNGLVSLSRPFTYATLPASPDGGIVYCSDCNATCTAGSGPGRFCFHSNGSWAVTGATTLYSTASITPVAVAGQTCSDQTFAVAGLKSGDLLSQVTPPSPLGNVSLNAYASANDTILLHFCNPTGGNITPPAGVYSMLDMGSGPSVAGTFEGGPGTAADVTGIGTVAWTNPSNALTNNATYAVATLPVTNHISHYLRLTNFGFSIPGGATVDGVKLTTYLLATTTSTLCEDASIKLVKAGSEAGNDKASSLFWPYTEGIQTYGGPSDLWGLTLAPADVNSANFGVSVAAQSLGGDTAGCDVDYVTLKIYYH